jgi:membrane protease YdiL (CAAX protease family)
VQLPDLARRRVVEICVVFSTFMLPGYLSVALSGTTTVSAALPTVLLVGLPQACFVLYLLWTQGEIRRPELGLRRWVAPDFLAAAVVLGALLAVQLAGRGALRLMPDSARAAAESGVRFRLSGPAELPAAVLFCGVAAAREEILYRAYFFVRLADLGLPPAVAAAVSTALFAAAHAYQGPLSVALALVQGLVLAGAFVRTRNIGVPIAAHACHNLVVLALTLAPTG